MYTATDVQRPKGRVMRGEYVCDGQQYMVDAYDSVYEMRDGAWQHIGKLNGRKPEQAIADMLNAEND